MQVQEILKSKTEVFLDQLAEAATKTDAETLNTAIRDFQTKAGIQVDGKVGPETRKAFQDAMKNTGETPPDTTDDARAARTNAPAQEPAAPAQQTPAQEPAAPAQQTPAPAPAAAAPAAQAARQQPAAPAQRQQPAAAPAQQPAARPAATGGSGPGGAYTAGDVNNGNMPSGLPKETITNIQAAAAAARDPGAIVYDPNDDADF